MGCSVYDGVSRPGPKLIEAKVTGTNSSGSPVNPNLQMGCPCIFAIRVLQLHWGNSKKLSVFSANGEKEVVLAAFLLYVRSSDASRRVAATDGFPRSPLSLPWMRRFRNQPSGYSLAAAWCSGVGGVASCLGRRRLERRDVKTSRPQTRLDPLGCRTDVRESCCIPLSVSQSVGR